MKTTWTMNPALLALLSSQVLAANVVHLSMQRRDVPAGIVRRSTVQATLENAVSQSSYLTNVTVGTPGQNIQLVVDTGSSDVFVVSSKADECTDPSVQQQYGPCLGGTFDSASSKTFDDTITGGFNISYVDGTGSSGDYFQDTFTIAGTTLTKLQMGLALQLTTGTGVMGVGYDKGESVQQANVYPNLIDTLVSEQKINRKAYSLYLDDLETSTGSLLFGGIDTKKFIGSLKIMNTLVDFQTGQIDSFNVNLTSVTFTSNGKTQNLVGSTDGATLDATVVLDSGTTLTYVPEGIYSNIVSVLNGKTSSSAGGDITTVDCSLRSSSAFFSYGFVGSGGPVINVPVSEVVLSPSSGGNGQVCELGVLSASEPPYLFGDTFLRSAYVVYDLDNNQIGIAQTNFGESDSNIVEIQAGATSLPSITGVSSGQTTIPTGSSSGSGSGSGSSSTGSNTKNAALQTVPSFDKSALAVLLVSVGFAVLGGVGFLA